AKSALKAGVNKLGVALIEEALELRENKVAAPIQALAEQSGKSIKTMIDNDIIPTVYSLKYAEEIDKEAAKKNKKVKVHLKVDTGMNRLGSFPEELLRDIGKYRSFNNLEIEGIMTHFAKADEPDDGFTDKQLSSFLNLIESLKRTGLEIPIKHAANSAAVFYFPKSHLNMIRVGIAMYGLVPSVKKDSPVELKPVMSLKTNVMMIKEIRKGDGVSYGHRFIAEKNMKIAVLPLGYADGYTRMLSLKSDVLIKGRRCPVLGNICMDQIMVDISALEDIGAGEEVILLGRQKDQEVTATELASLLGTINYEITCMVSKRVHRKYLD
ncbi:MAG: alanine racemase, partial [Actinomycetia bacterium]|nr:alanine racemase [Actinomycetes bacterium]